MEGFKRVPEEQTKREALDRFEQLGFHQVESLVLTGGIPQAWHNYAIEWLAAKKNAKA